MTIKFDDKRDEQAYWLRKMADDLNAQAAQDRYKKAHKNEKCTQD